MSRNEVSLTGIIASTPFVRTNQSGIKSASFFLTVDNDWPDSYAASLGHPTKQTSTLKIKIERHDFAVFLKNWLKKGDEIHISGRLRTTCFENLHGQIIHKTSIVLDSVCGSLSVEAPSFSASNQNELEQQNVAPSA